MGHTSLYKRKRGDERTKGKKIIGKRGEQKGKKKKSVYLKKTGIFP